MSILAGWNITVSHKLKLFLSHELKFEISSPKSWIWVEYFLVFIILLDTKCASKLWYSWRKHCEHYPHSKTCCTSVTSPTPWYWGQKLPEATGQLHPPVLPVSNIGHPNLALELPPPVVRASRFLLVMLNLNIVIELVLDELLGPLLTIMPSAYNWGQPWCLAEGHHHRRQRRGRVHFVIF